MQNSFGMPPESELQPNNRGLTRADQLRINYWAPTFWPPGATQGAQDAGTIAGVPFGGTGGGNPQQALQQYPAADYAGNPELMRPLIEYLENMRLNTERTANPETGDLGSGPTYMFENFGETLDLPRMSQDEIRRHMIEQGHGGRPDFERTMELFQTNPSYIWEFLDPTWANDLAELPSETPAPEETPAPVPESDIPPIEYTYPTETLPQAEPPPLPSFMNNRQLHPGQPRWIPPIRPLSQDQDRNFMPRARGGRAQRGYADGGDIEAILSQGAGRPLTGWGSILQGTPPDHQRVYLNRSNQVQVDPPNSPLQGQYPPRKWGLLGPEAPPPVEVPPPPDLPPPEPETPPVEYTYPTETLPQAEPPPQPSFLNRPQNHPGAGWIPPIREISGNTFRRKGGRISKNDVNRARLRAVVSAKRGDFNG